MRADSAEAKALAEFLRRQIEASSKTLGALETEIAWSSSQISVYVGGALPKADFVTALIKATTSAELRERRLSEGAQLLRLAQHPAEAHHRLPAGSQADLLLAAQTQRLETYDRLTRSLEKQAELDRAATNSARLVMVLLGMIHTLDRRVQTLSEERDQQSDPTALRIVQSELERATEQEQRARAELQRAEDKQQQAELLAERVQEQVRQLTEELDRLRAQGPMPADAAVATEVEIDLAVAAVREVGDRVGDDIDQALDRAGTANDTDADVLRRITDELATAAPAAVTPLVPHDPADIAAASALVPDAPGPWTILWVDDNPSGNTTEMANLRAFGITVQLATSTDAATSVLTARPFDAIISDMGRREHGGFNPDAGLDLIREVRNRGHETPVFIYSSNTRRRAEIQSAGGNGVAAEATTLRKLLHTAIPIPTESTGNWPRGDLDRGPSPDWPSHE